VENAINDMQKKAARREIDVDLLILEELRKGCSTLSAKIKMLLMALQHFLIRNKLRKRSYKRFIASMNTY
jgi:hypothetical protein